VNHPESDGLAEKQIRNINTKMRLYLLVNPDIHWAFVLPIIMHAINITTTRKNFWSPHKIMHSRYPDTIFGKGEKIKLANSELHLRIKEINSKYYTETANQETKKYKKSNVSFAEGERVLLLTEHTPPKGPWKFGPRSTGPYTVT
jgi:hypothetical protein